MEKIKKIILRNTETGEILSYNSFDEFTKKFKETYSHALQAYISFTKKDENSFLSALEFNFNCFASTAFSMIKIEYQKEQDLNKKKRSVGNGEGSLFYSKTLKKWIYQWTEGFDLEGKQIKKQLKQWTGKGETKKDFIKRINELENSRNKGTYIEKSQDTTQKIIQKHINQKFKDGITKGNSYNRDKYTLKQIEKCCIKFINKPIQQVTFYDIQEAKEAMKKYSQSNINKMWHLLKKAFSIASSPSIKIIPVNIMNDENLKKPTSDLKVKKIYPLTKTEREKLNYILDNEEKNHKYRDIVKIQWLTGMRIGEVLARSKEDIKENFTVLHIYNTLTKDEDGKTILGEHTKTYDKKTGIDKGERYFPIDKDLKKLLKKQLSKHIINIYGLLFWDYEDNTFVTENEVNSWLQRINEKYGITDLEKGLHTHRLRHDRITQWKEIKNMDEKAIQYFAGHVEDSAITGDVYIDISREYAFKEYEKVY